MVTKERKRELLACWLNEMEGSCGQNWRDKLSGEELPLVDRWDNQYINGAYRVCLAIVQSATSGL